MLELMESMLGESLSVELHRETAEQRANRIIAEELARRGWPESWLRSHPNFGPWTLDFGLRPRQAGQRCPAAERNDPADQVDCGAGADRHGQRGQVRAPSSGSEPRPTQIRKRPRTLRPARIPIYGLTPFPDPFPDPFPFFVCSAARSGLSPFTIGSPRIRAAGGSSLQRAPPLDPLMRKRAGEGEREHT
jgi:hypothetical protein